MVERIKETILLVEDEPDVAQVIRMNLERSGYVVDWCTSGEEALERVGRGGVDLALLDIVLPGGLDGRDVCRSIRADAENAKMPVIMLTSLTEETNIVIGLGAGADDYVRKPFSGLELVARVKAALRRTRGQREGDASRREAPLTVGELSLDPKRHAVTISGETVGLTLAEFRLLHHLMAHEGRAFTRQELLGQIVGEGVQVIERNVDVHVRNLRRKIGDYANNVVTVRGVGYRFDG
ncbi:MAG: response regulator transcription factor [Planctomycetota bacterium]